MQFLAYTKTPQYKATLQQLLGQEKVSSALPRLPCTGRPTHLADSALLSGGHSAVQLAQALL